MKGESYRSSGFRIMFLLTLVAILAVSGCTGSPPGVTDNETRNAYLAAYAAGIQEHAAGQDTFNNGTLAWEAGDLRTSIARYASASLNYSRAVKDYDVMARYARSEKEREFAASLSGCACNLSRASDDFVNAAIAMRQNDSDIAYQWFSQGQSCVDASDALLNRSIAAVPEWLHELASG